MNEEQKIKLEELKTQMQEKDRHLNLQKNVLFQECLKALYTYTLIEDEEVINKLVHLASMQDIEIYFYSDILIICSSEALFIIK